MTSVTKIISNTKNLAKLLSQQRRYLFLHHTGKIWCPAPVHLETLPVHHVTYYIIICKQMLLLTLLQGHRCTHVSLLSLIFLLGYFFSPGYCQHQFNNKQLCVNLLRSSSLTDPAQRHCLGLAGTSVSATSSSQSSSRSTENSTDSSLNMKTAFIVEPRHRDDREWDITDCCRHVTISTVLLSSRLSPVVFQSHFCVFGIFQKHVKMWSWFTSL